MVNFPAPIQPEWATYCESRSPKFKVHATKGHAYGAVSDKRPNTPISLYQFKDGEWQVVLDFKPPEACEQCGGDFYYDAYGRKHKQRYIFAYGFSNPKWQLPIICHSCYNSAYQKYANQKEFEAAKAKYEKLAKQLGK